MEKLRHLTQNIELKRNLQEQDDQHDKSDEEIQSDDEENEDGDPEAKLDLKISEMYENNIAKKLHQELSTPEKYMSQILKSIKLSDLYEIVDYIYTSEK